MLLSLIDQMMEIFKSLGYFGIYIVMLMESSLIPLPSEAIIIPAGMLVNAGEMSFLGVFLASTLGAVSGASINYFLGRLFGEIRIKYLVERFGKYFFIKNRELDLAKKYFTDHGSVTTFIGRLIPIIRQFISIPAGIFKMNYFKFFVFTFLGAGIWNAFLIWVGYTVGENKEKLAEYETWFLIGTIPAVILIILIYREINKFVEKKIKGNNKLPN